MIFYPLLIKYFLFLTLLTCLKYHNNVIYSTMYISRAHATLDVLEKYWIR